jgi:hypothetical protein
MKVNFDGENKLILIHTGITEIDVKLDLYSDWKEWILIGDNSKYLSAMRAVGGDPISGTKQLGSTYFLTNGWRIKPASWDHRLFVVGNLYTDEGASPYLNVDGSYSVMIISEVSTLVEATIQQLPEIEHSSFNGVVTIDVINGVSGTLYPIGTSTNPVNNLNDAKIIAAYRGFKTLYLKSDLTIISGSNIDEYTLKSDNWLSVTIENNVSLVNTFFEKLSLYGVMGGFWNVLVDCWVYDITNFCGWLRGGSFVNIELAPYTVESAGQSFFDNIIPMYPNTPSVLVMNTDVMVSFTNAVDTYEIRSMTSGSTISIGLNEGKVIIDSSCIGGNILIGGIGDVINNSQLTPDITSLIRGEEIQYSSYNNGITIDQINGTDSSIYPYGTPSEPCKTLSNIIDITNNRGFKNVYIRDDLNIVGIEEFDGYTFIGNGKESSKVIVGLYSGNTYTQMLNCRFNEVCITGNFGIGSTIIADKCNIGAICGTTIDARDCSLSSEIYLPIGESNFTTCVDGIPGSGAPIINVGDCLSLGFWRWSGGVVIENMINNTQVSFNINSGRMVINSSCTSGEVIARGIGTIVNNSNGTIVNQTSMIDNLTTSDYIWSQNLIGFPSGSAGYVLSGLTGLADVSSDFEQIKNDMSVIVSGFTGINDGINDISNDLIQHRQETELRIKYILGLEQSNFRIVNQTYNSNNLLTSSKIRIYENKDDANLDINPLNEYDMFAQYYSNGRVIEYKVIES